MGRITQFSALVAALALVAWSCGGPVPKLSNTPAAQGQTDDAAVTHLIEQEFDLFRQRNWHAVYEDYSPSFRASCSYDKFEVLILASFGGFDPAEVTATDIRVRVTNDKATATYAFISSGKRVSVVDDKMPDLYSRIGDRWYDEPDAPNWC